MGTERTLVLIKPGAVEKGLVGEIIRRIELLGLRLVRMNMLTPTMARCLDHYNKDDEWCERQGQKKIGQDASSDMSALEHGRRILELIAEHMMSGYVAALIFEGNNAVAAVRKIAGPTEPLTAPPGTIRGDLGTDSFELANLENRAIDSVIHTSDSLEEAAREIGVWFPGTME